MTDAASKPSSREHAALMDRMYRYTRYVYDASRKYYLFGRDRLLRQMTLADGDRVLEMGCGTARNLIVLDRLHPGHQLFGLDASQAMLDVARVKADRRGLKDRLQLKQALAEELTLDLFGQDRPFDVIFFSYALSMMPTWPQAVEAAIACVKPGGRIYVVDFWDQAGLPRPFAFLLKRWLAMFHVHYRPELMAHFETLAREGRIELSVESIGGRYAYLAQMRTPA